MKLCGYVLCAGIVSLIVLSSGIGYSMGLGTGLKKAGLTEAQITRVGEKLDPQFNPAKSYPIVAVLTAVDQSGVARGPGMNAANVKRKLMQALGVSPVFAVVQKDAQLLKALVGLGFRLDERPAGGWDAVETAINFHDNRMLNFVFDLGAKPYTLVWMEDNGRKIRPRNYLCVAIDNAFHPMVLKADSTAVTRSANPPDFSIVETLLKRGVDPDKHDCRDGKSPRETAEASGDQALIELFDRFPPKTP